MQIKMLFYTLGINALTSFSRSPPLLKWGMNAKNLDFIHWGFKPRLNKVKPPADATDFLEVICPILTGSRTPYQNHKGSTVRKDPTRSFLSALALRKVNQA